MLELRRVPLADIRPDEKNPRKDFGDLEALAASFAFTPDRPGEPVTPIGVAADGNVYRILDGERRYRAMAQAEQVDSCLCLVADSANDVETLLVMLATDDKRALSIAEREAGAQMSLLLGVDEDAVSDLARLDRRRVHAAKRGMARGAVQLPLSAAADIGELESDEDAARVLAALEGDEDPTRRDAPWKGLCRDLKSAQDARNRRAAVEATLEDAGVACVDSDPAQAGMAFMGYGTPWSIEDRIAECADFAEEHDCGWAVWLPPLEKGAYSWNGTAARFYVDAVEEADPEAERARLASEEQVRWSEALEAARDARFRYLLDLALDTASRDLMRIPAFDATARAIWEAALGQTAALDFADAVGREVPPACTPLAIALAWETDLYDGLPPRLAAQIATGDVRIEEREADMLRAWRDELDALEGAGYDATEAELELRGIVMEALATYGAREAEGGAE